MIKRKKNIVFLGSVLLIMAVAFFSFTEKNIIDTEKKEYYSGVIEENHSTNESSSFQIIERDEKITIVVE